MSKQTSHKQEPGSLVASLKGRRKDLFLTTKLYIPRPRDSVVLRSRLMERLNEALRIGHKLTLVSAPAGYGKTTLLSEWSARGECRVAWVSLDKGDNDPARFWTYFTSALQVLNPSIGGQALSLLQSSQPPPVESVMTTLVNEIDTFPDVFALVLDDYHVIEAQSIHRALTFLLDHLPPRMHLIIASRTDPHLPLAHLRARNELTELRANDLRFSPDETDAFLNQVMRLGLPPEDVSALDTRTEGWIAGLQLAALSMHERDDRSSFVAAFTGSHRFILDYLSDQVLQQQPDSLQSFLLQTSILDRMNASLCDAVLLDSTTKNGGTAASHGDSQAILEKLEQRNLFLIPLDDERRWYRYHHLFADVLRHRLQETWPDRVPELYRRASEWFEREGSVSEAITHALAAHEYERAAQLIERAIETLWQRGETMTLADWMQALPETVRCARPALCLAYARVLVDTAQFAAAEVYTTDAEQALKNNPPADQRVAVPLHGQVAALRAHLAVTRSEFAQAIELAHRAQELLAEDDVSWRSFVALSLAGAFRFTSDWAAASQAYLEASALSQSAGDTKNALTALSLRGETLQAQGQLHQAVQQYEQVLQLAQAWGIPNAPVTGCALVDWGRVRCEWNDLDAAVHLAESGIERGRQANILDVLLRGYFELTRIRQAQGDLEGALAALDEAEPIVQQMGVAEIKNWLNALRAQVWLAQGQIEAAVRWANGVAGVIHDAVYPAVPIALARVRLAQGQPDEAVRLLEHALQTSEQVGRLGNAIQILVVKALAHRAQGNPEQALAALERAVALAEPEGYVRVFVDEGEPMARLLHRAAVRVPASDYIQQLLEGSGDPSDAEPLPSTSLVEPLSERERQVLQLIADGATNQEIATELVLSLNTVKKHASNIFGKLGASNRAQAIARARELGLL